MNTGKDVFGKGLVEINKDKDKWKTEDHGDPIYLYEEHCKRQNLRHCNGQEKKYGIVFLISDFAVSGKRPEDKIKYAYSDTGYIYIYRI